MSELARPFPLSPVPEVQWTRVTPYASSDWFVDAIRGVAKIATLPANWDSYGSQPLTAIAKTCAIGLAMKFGREQLPEPRVVPISGGGLQFEFTSGPRSLELEVLPDGTIEFLRVYADDQMKEGQIGPHQSDYLHEQVNWLTQHP